MDVKHAYWEGKGFFQPLNREIEYFIDAGKEGPTEEQVAFYKEVENRYEELLKQARVIFDRECGEWLSRDVIEQYEKPYILSSLSIPRMDERPLQWEMSYDCALDVDHLFSVQLRDWHAEGVTIDG